MKKYGLYKKYIKRPMDFIRSLIAIIVFSSLLLIVALLVRVKLGSPAVFKQQTWIKWTSIYDVQI